MGIEQFLTNSDKVASLNKVKELLAFEIYSLLLRIGIDPEGFDYATYQRPEITVDNDSIAMQLLALEKHINSFISVIKKLEVLENA